jgi:SH3-like domain-containing protein
MRGLLGRVMFVAMVVVSVAGGAIFLLEGEHAVASGSPPPPIVEPVPAGAMGKSGLPLPRFVSLKAGRVNVRVGPGEDYKVAWVFTKSALPVEIIQEFDTWRRIRDSDGQVGWVFHSLLSGKRTAVVSPWTKGDPLPLRSRGTASSAVTAYLQPGVEAAVDRCAAGWCDLSGKGFSGWIEQNQLWGVYPDELVD